MNDAPAFDPRTLTRPDPRLLQYYFITSLFALVLFPFAFIPQWIKYRTLWYSFDDEGVRMGWGLLWKREINLTYRRIQDIHVTRGLVQRWLGLANVAVQTASGSSAAEMTIIGILEPEKLRDFLYQRMRGAKGQTVESDTPQPTDEGDELLETLHDIRDALRALSAREGARQ